MKKWDRSENPKNYTVQYVRQDGLWLPTIYHSFCRKIKETRKHKNIYRSFQNYISRSSACESKRSTPGTKKEWRNEPNTPTPMASEHIFLLWRRNTLRVRESSTFYNTNEMTIITRKPKLTDQRAQEGNKAFQQYSWTSSEE